MNFLEIAKGLEAVCWGMFVCALLAGAVYVVTLTPPCQTVTDNTQREKLFFECLKKIPTGPKSVHYNDWAEVVEECGVQARNLATKIVCKGEK